MFCLTRFHVARGVKIRRTSMPCFSAWRAMRSPSSRYSHVDDEAGPTMITAFIPDASAARTPGVARMAMPLAMTIAANSSALNVPLPMVDARWAPAAE